VDNSDLFMLSAWVPSIDAFFCSENDSNQGLHLIMNLRASATKGDDKLSLQLISDDGADVN
jgi:hypothetical protein